MVEGMRDASRSVNRLLRLWRHAEQGLTLVEALAAVVLLTWGVLVLLDVMPRGLRLGELGKDQSAATVLAQQKLEYYKGLGPSTCVAPGFGNCPFTPGDYGINAGFSVPAQGKPECLDPNGNLLSATYAPGSTCDTAFANKQAYFARDAQIQVWIWNGTQFAKSATPFAQPSSQTPRFVYRVSVATYWYVRGQNFDQNKGWYYLPGATAFQAGGNATNGTGCMAPGGTAVNRNDPGPASPMGLGCIQVSTFVSSPAP